MVRLILSLSEGMGFKVLEINIDLDHVHLLINCKPRHYISDIIKRLKGTTALWLFKLYPELKKELWKGHLWNPSYFISTVSENLEDNIVRYIKNQGR